MSNHPKTIINELPRNVEKRLSILSSNRKIFDDAKQPYIDALESSGFKNVELNYQPKQNTKKPRKSKSVLFCNLPWNMAVKTNIGKEFLSLIDMFKGTP